MQEVQSPRALRKVTSDFFSARNKGKPVAPRRRPTGTAWAEARILGMCNVCWSDSDRNCAFDCLADDCTCTHGVAESTRMADLSQSP